MFNNLDSMSFVCNGKLIFVGTYHNYGEQIHGMWFDSPNIPREFFNATEDRRLSFNKDHIRREFTFQYVKDMNNVYKDLSLVLKVCGG